MPQVPKPERDQKIYGLVCQGFSYREIARKFRISHTRVSVIFWKERKKLQMSRKYETIDPVHKSV